MAHSLSILILLFLLRTGSANGTWRSMLPVNISLIRGSHLRHDAFSFSTTHYGLIALRMQYDNGSSPQSWVWRYQANRTQPYLFDTDAKTLLETTDKQTFHISDFCLLTVQNNVYKSIDIYHWSQLPSLVPQALKLPAHSVLTDDQTVILRQDMLLMSVSVTRKGKQEPAVLHVDNASSKHPYFSYIYCPEEYQCSRLGGGMASSSKAVAVFGSVTDTRQVSKHALLIYIRADHDHWEYVASITVADNAYATFINDTVFYYHSNNQLIMLNLVPSQQDGATVWQPSQPLNRHQIADLGPGEAVEHNDFWLLKYDAYTFTLYGVYSDPADVIYTLRDTFEAPVAAARFTRNHTLILLRQDGHVVYFDLLPLRIIPSNPIISTPRHASVRPTRFSTPRTDIFISTPSPESKTLSTMQEMLTIVGAVCGVLGGFVGFVLRKRMHRRRTVMDLDEAQPILGDKDDEPLRKGAGTFTDLFPSPEYLSEPSDDSQDSLGTLSNCADAPVKTEAEQLREGLEHQCFPDDASVLLHAWTERGLDMTSAAECLTVLLEYGADVNHYNPQTGHTPLLNACFYNDVVSIALLLEHRADVNTCDSLGRTPLALACCVGATEAIDVLVYHAPTLTKIPSDNGYLPLHWAVLACEWTGIQILLNASEEAFAVVTGNEGWNCLHLVAREGNVELLQHLLEWNRKEGTLYVIEIDDQGRTPCDIARLSSNQACYDLLLEAVAEVKGEADETDAQLRERLLRNRAMRRYRSRNPKHTGSSSKSFSKGKGRKGKKRSSKAKKRKSSES
eukprot:TRINITY_DN10363_c0_g2_i1.p1 TRINITY_DN10363_c0_g2~~TRINITY_DN10363_c0_g2_i1.p1  ORF type:complete len:790 (+),score=120.59 TRINITY_DN10363_c0_g2_i1:197-2566(+)